MSQQIYSPSGAVGGEKASLSSSSSKQHQHGASIAEDMALKDSGRATVVALPTDEAELKRLTKRMLLKMDVQVVTIALIIYFLSFLDRSNIGQARLNGLEADLGMTGRDYSIALTALYVPYIIFEIPSNLLIKRLTPRIWLPGLLTAWGLVTTLQGIVHTKTGLYIARAFLGFAEAGVLPGLSLWLTFFYQPKEIMLRQAIYFSGASLSGAFSGLLSTAIGKMSGISGLNGWQWIFILEGIFTVIVGAALFFIVPNGPKDLFFLTPEERALCLKRLEPPVAAADDSDVYVEKFRGSEVLRAITDPRNILMAISGTCIACPLYGLSFFSPSILRSLGYTAVRAQLFSCIPFACAFVVTVMLAIGSDHYGRRMPAALFSYVVAFAGFLMAYLIPLSNPTARFGALIVATVGAFSGPASTLSWVSTMNSGHFKKATSVGLYITFTNSGGLASCWMWFDAPLYRTGFLTNIILSIIGFFCIVGIEILIKRDWRRKDAGKADHLVEHLKAQGHGPRAIYDILGDRHPAFRAML